MEQKIPIPTDRLAKFAAVGGLVFTVIIIGAVIRADNEGDREIMELKTLRMSSGSNAILEASIADREAQQQFNRKASAVLVVVFVLVTIWGFATWRRADKREGW